MTQKKTNWNGFSLRPRKEMPEGLWMKCPSCEHMLYRSAVEKNLNVCPECNYHFRDRGLDPHPAARGRGHVPADPRGPDHRRPAGLQVSRHDVQAADQGRPEEDRHEGGHAHRQGLHQGPRRHPQRHGAELPHGLHGGGRRREVLHRRGQGHGGVAAAGRRDLFRRGPHARGRRLPRARWPRPPPPWPASTRPRACSSPS